MNITYNGVANPSDMLTFSEVPNILKITEDISGTYAYFLITCSNGFPATADTQFYFTMYGETVTNVLDPTKAKNKRFYGSSDAVSFAASFASALRNCPSIAADFNIVPQGDEVYLCAKTIGSKFSGQTIYTTNIPSQYLNVGVTDGTSSSDLYGSKILVDLFSEGHRDVDNYITTLEKNWYGNECAFDLTPVLATISEYGKANEYGMDITKISENGIATWLGTIGGRTTVGYRANQSDKFLYITGAQVLSNSTRNGNPIRMYVYGDTLPYSVLTNEDTSRYGFNISYYDSLGNRINWYASRLYRENIIDDVYLELDQYWLEKSAYIEVMIGSSLMRYYVIKPLKASEGYQRVLWRNEYGGLSFFDFTGQRTESDSIEIETYEKNVFDYYDNEEFEKKKIYKNDYTKEVKLTSHLMEEDGKWIFNSLMNSKKVWTIINGKTYYIIPKSIEINENEQYNGIYTARLTYTYSDI